MSFIDLFSEKADLYAAARPRYPEELYAYVAEIAPTRGRAWDCATGNGQAAVGLAEYFDRVEATDASAAQIANALPCAKVQYSVQPAERTNFADTSFDAVCVAQALHWFKLDEFYAEVRRVLKPGGVCVVWGYDWFAVDPAFDEQFKYSMRDVLAPYWAPQNALLWNGYRDVPFPFARLETPKLEMRMQWIFGELLAFVHTWSATRRCLAEEGPGFFKKAEEQLATLWGEHADERRTVTMNLHLLAGRKTTE